MDKYLVLGNPISHSRSPQIHALFAAQLQEDISYDRLLVRVDGLEACLQDLAAKGIAGCNITVPFKEAAYQLAQQHTPRSKWAQAGNTIRFTPEGMVLENTDGLGLVRDIENNAGLPLKDKHIALLGAGGAAAGALATLIERGPASLTVLNRTSERALHLVARHRPYAQRVSPHTRLEARPMADLPRIGPVDVIINATAASLKGEALALPKSILRPSTLVYDMMYGASAQGFLGLAQAQGLATRDGLGMLVEQAAEAYYFWRGKRPKTAPVLAQLRAEIEASQ